MARRARIVVAAALAVAGLALAPGLARGASLEPMGSFSKPIYVTSEPGDPDRLLVVERAGRIKLVSGGQVSVFANLTSLVDDQDGERGLLSIALAPDYGATGRLYAFYTGHDAGALHVDELTANGDFAPLATRRQVLTIPHPNYANHNGGQLQFGPDGYLYVSTGDGGGGGDPDENAQDTGSLLGKLLRIDPRQSGSAPYTVPGDNPFVGRSGRDEIWSYGLRNPWRFSFDRLTGALAIGDVGQGKWEEVDYDPAPAGGRGVNYGWSCREGAHDFKPGRCAPGTDLTDPVHEYSHAGGGCSITGGYVARDPGLPELAGRYVYTDFCVGEIRSVALEAGAASGDRCEVLGVPQPVSFGEDAAGRLYVTSLGGQVYRLVEGEPPEGCGAPDPPPPSDPPDPPPTDPSPPPPASTPTSPDAEAPTLELKPKPKAKRVRRGRRARFRAVVANMGDARARGVRVCLRAPKRAVKVGRRCRRIGTLAPGERARAAFKPKARMRARKGRRYGLRLIARSHNAGRDRARARLKVKKR